MPEKLDDATYNLKAVVRETGIKPDTLRAWERRYGLPLPTRSSGRHRLYTQQDIDTLKWLVARRAEGLSISRAVAMWRGYLQQGKDPLVEVPLTAPLDLSIPHVTGDAMEGLREAWIQACKAYDEDLAEAALGQAFAQFPPEIVVLELLTKGLAEIGEDWYSSKATVQQEHFASALAIRRLEALHAAASPPSRPGKILVACAPEDEHSFSALVLSFLLRRNGWEVLYLGANVPSAQLDQTLEVGDIDLAIFTAQHLRSASRLLQIAEVLHENEVPFAYGGSIFVRMPRLQERIPGLYLADEFAAVIESVDRLLKERPATPEPETPPVSYSRALRKLIETQSAIDRRTWQAMQGTDIPFHLLSIANTFITQDIRAALELGDMRFIGDDLSWVMGLLKNYGLPEQYLLDFLNAYYAALNDVWDGSPDPILDYFKELFEEPLQTV